MANQEGSGLISVSRPLVLLYSALPLALVAAALLMSSFGQDLERKIGLKLLFQLRGALPAPPRVLVVSINDSAAQHIGLPEAVPRYQRCEDLRVGILPETHRSLPPASRLADWPRCVHARLVDALHDMGADTIVFDVTFRERDPFMVNGQDLRAEQDKQFAAAMHRAGNVLLTTKVYDSAEQTHDHPPSAESLRTILSAASISTALRQEAIGVAPFHLADVAAPYGRFYLYSAADTARPSIAVLTLLFHLRQAYPQVLERIPTGALSGAGLPAISTASFTPGELEAMALQLRQLLRLSGTGQSSDSKGSVQNTEVASRRWIAALLADPVFHVNFYGPPGTIETISYEEVLTPQAPEDIKQKVRGSVVFVGYAEHARPEQADHFESYFSRADGVHFSGVELAATVFANLVDGSGIRHAPSFLAYAILALSAFVPLGITVYRPKTVGFLIAVGIGLAYVLLAHFLFKFHNLWLPIVIPLAITLPAALLISFGWQTYVQTRQRKELEAFLGRLLPREVVERIRQNMQRIRTPNQPTSGACVATDIERFSTLSERISPDDLVKLMDSYFSVLTRQVARNDGIVSNMAGDEMIAIWGNEGSDESNCRHACLASLDIQAAVAAFNAGEARTPLPTRIGVHFGPMSFGSLEGHASLGAFGDTINTASRIQNLNKTLRTRLLISAEAFRGSSEFLTRDVGLFILKGKAQLTRVFELISAANAATPEQRRLCAEFAVALGVCRSGRPSEALQLFRDLLARFPEDGPTAYYVQYIAEHPQWDGQAIAVG